jgi:hypothetical protein
MSGISADAHPMGTGATPSRHIPRAGALLANHHQQQAPAPREPVTLGPQTKINLATVAAILVVGIPLLWQVWELRQAVRGIWTVHDQERFIAECQERNPSLLLPRVIEIIARRLPGGTP